MKPSKPDVVWLLSDGEINGTADGAAEVRQGHDGKLRINTITKYAKSPEAEEVLWTISDDAKGVCIGADGKRFVPKGKPREPDKLRLAPTGPSIFQGPKQ